MMPSTRHVVLAALPLLAGLAILAPAEPPAMPGADRQAHTTAATDAGIGRLIALPALVDFAGETHNHASLSGDTATVIAMADLSCPVSLKYRPVLARLEEEWRDKGVRFVFVNSTGTDTAEAVAETVKQLGFEGPWIDDGKRAAAGMLAARSTTEVFVLDGARTLVYRGAVDDQHSLGASRPEARSHYLADALAAVSRGERPTIEITAAPGCVLDLPEAAAPATTVTYHNRISRIMLDNCVSCHREGGVAPFALDSYDAVAKRSAMIRLVLDEGIMPPWHATPSDDASLAFANDRTVPPADKADLLAWLEGDKPEGDAGDGPLARKFPDGWQIGTPDAVFKLPRPMEVAAEGFMDYQHVRVETHFMEDKWIKAIQVKPTDTRVVHHILVYAIPPQDMDGSAEARQRLRETFDTSSGFFAAYVPGNDHVTFPEGLAKKIPAGATLIFQLHYTPNGVATTDQSELGLVFADDPPKSELMVRGIVDRRLAIPPGAAAHEEGSEIPVSRDVMLIGMMPHMHVRGKAMRYELTLPDGTTRTLLDVPRYDFNWQTAYRLKEPLPIPAGSRLKVTALFDNSEANPFNPDPAKLVRWGDQTTDEMMIGYVEFYYADEPKPE